MAISDYECFYTLEDFGGGCHVADRFWVDGWDYSSVDCWDEDGFYHTLDFDSGGFSAEDLLEHCLDMGIQDFNFNRKEIEAWVRDEQQRRAGEPGLVLDGDGHNGGNATE